MGNLKERSDKIEILERFAKFLEKNGYLDTDWQTEPPYAIDTFLAQDKEPIKDPANYEFKQCIKCKNDVMSESGQPLNSDYCNDCYWGITEG
jgi:hypothetical protein